MPTGVRTAAHSRRPAAGRVRHGQASCADYGCVLSICRSAARTARRERDRDRDQGLAARVDASPAARYALVLRERGMSAQDIATKAGIAVTLVRRLLRAADRRPARIARTTHDAVLGVPLPHAALPPPSAGLGLVDAAPAAAKLAELAVHGWPANHLAARLRVNPRTIAAVRDGHHARTTIALAQRVRRLHRELVNLDPVTQGVRPADVSRARAWAARRAGTSSSGRAVPGQRRRVAA